MTPLRPHTMLTLLASFPSSSAKLLPMPPSHSYYCQPHTHAHPSSLFPFIPRGRPPAPLLLPLPSTPSPIPGTFRGRDYGTCKVGHGPPQVPPLHTRSSQPTPRAAIPSCGGAAPMVLRACSRRSLPSRRRGIPPRMEAHSHPPRNLFLRPRRLLLPPPAAVAHQRH